MQKLTKEQMLSELMIKLETIDGKLDKLLNSDLRIITNVSVVGDPEIVAERVKNTLRNTLMTNQEFDEAYK